MKTYGYDTEKIKDILINFIIFAIGIYVFLIFGRGEYNLQKDSATYMSMPATVSVMPVYPLLIGTAQRIFGAGCLSALVIMQGFLALFCTWGFSVYICRKFDISGIERLVVYLPTLLPFLIYLPDYIVTQQILTEGITYSLMYIYVIALFHTITEKTYGGMAATAICGVILNLCRSQFIIIHIITVSACVLVFLKKKKLNLFKRAVIWCTGAIALLLLVISVYLFATVIIYKLYPAVADKNTQSDTMAVHSGAGMLSDDKDSTLKYNMEKADLSYQVSYKGQFAEIIILRGFYLAKAGDERYFSNEMTRGAFLAIYEQLSGEKVLFEASGIRLGYWQDMFNEKITRSAYAALKEYYGQQGLSGDLLWKSIHNDFIRIGITLITRHFSIFIFCFLRLLGAGLMAGLFYQKLSIYVICMIMTAFMFSAGIYFLISGRGNKKTEMEHDYLLTVSAVIVVFVVIIFLLVPH